MNKFIKISDDIKNTTLEEIQEIEKEYKLYLPNDYKDFLTKYSGYEIDKNHIYKLNIDSYIYKYNVERREFYKNIYGDKLGSVWFFPLKEYLIKNWENSIEDDYDIYPERIKNKILPFAFDGLRQILLGISLSKKNNGYIYLLDDEFIFGEKSFILIEKSFTDFINKFEKCNDDEIF